MRDMSEEQLSSQDGDGFAVASVPAARRRARGSAWIYVCIAIVAGIAAGGIASVFLADSLKALGIPDPGRVTTVGLPFVRAAAWIAMATSVGSFVSSSTRMRSAMCSITEKSKRPSSSFFFLYACA